MRGLEDLRIEDLRGLEDLRDPWRIEDLELEALPPHSRVPTRGRRIRIYINICIISLLDSNLSIHILINKDY